MTDAKTVSSPNLIGWDEAHDMTSCQGKPVSEGDKGLDLEHILKQLGSFGRYQKVQHTLNLFSSFVSNIALYAVVFLGYQPDYQCSKMDNVTQLEDYIPDDVTNFTLHDVQYHQCSIDVTVNTSGTSSTHSLPCVDGVNFSMPSHTSFLTEWSLVCDRSALTEITQTGYFGGQAAGSLLFAILADRYGRRKVYTFCAVATLASMVSMAFVHTYDVLLVCRMASGFFQAGMENSAYTMFVELLPRQHRFLASVVDAMLWSLSCVFLAAAAYFLQGVSWRYLTLTYGSAFVFALLLPWLLDESLRWLIATGNINEAEQILKKACRMNGKDFENIKPLLQKASPAKPLDALNGEVSSSSSHEPATTGLHNDRDANKEERNPDAVCHGKNRVDGGSNQRDSPLSDGQDYNQRNNSPLESHSETVFAKYTVLDLFRHRIVLVPFLVCTFAWITANMFLYAVMLGSANLSGNRFLNFGLLALLQIPSTLLVLFLMPRFSRRLLGFLFGTVSGGLLLLSVGLVALGGGVTLTLATVAQYIAMFSLNGTHILLYVYSAEVFPTALRAVGTGAMAGINQVTDMASPFLLVWGEETPWAPGILVGCLCCLASFSLWLLPETRHRKLPDTIEEMQAWKKHRIQDDVCKNEK